MLADDALTREGALARLRDYPGLRPLSAAQRRRADVHLVFAAGFTGATMELLESLAASSLNPAAGIVLITSHVPGPFVLRAVRSGVRSVLPRTAQGFDVVVEAVRDVARGDARMSPTLQGRPRAARRQAPGGCRPPRAPWLGAEAVP